MYVGESLLHNPENCGFDFIRKPAQVRREIEINGYFASFGEALDEPLNGGGQASLIQQRWVQQVRHGAQFLRHFAHQFKALLTRPGCLFAQTV